MRAWNLTFPEVSTPENGLAPSFAEVVPLLTRIFRELLYESRLSAVVSMSKRKRGTEDGSDTGEWDNSGAVHAQKQRLESVLERSKKTLFQALKLARGFERQKLGRRQKVAKAAEDDGVSKRLASEVIALKVSFRMMPSNDHADNFPLVFRFVHYRRSSPI